MTVESRKLTGRGWGDRKPGKILRRFEVNGVQMVTYEAEFWDGPTTPDESGQYERLRVTESLGAARTSKSRCSKAYDGLLF